MSSIIKWTSNPFDHFEYFNSGLKMVELALLCSFKAVGEYIVNTFNGPNASAV